MTSGESSHLSPAVYQLHRVHTNNYIYGADCGYICGYILTSSSFFLFSFCFFVNWDKQISMPDDYIGCSKCIYMVLIMWPYRTITYGASNICLLLHLCLFCLNIEIGCQNIYQILITRTMSRNI